MMDTLEIVKVSFVIGAFIGIIYKVVVWILLFDKDNIFEKNGKGFLDVEEQYFSIKIMRYTAYFFLMVSFCFLIVYVIQI